MVRLSVALRLWWPLPVGRCLDPLFPGRGINKGVCVGMAVGTMDRDRRADLSHGVSSHPGWLKCASGSGAAELWRGHTGRLDSAALHAAVR